MTKYRITSIRIRVGKLLHVRYSGTFPLQIFAMNLSQTDWNKATNSIMWVVGLQPRRNADQGTLLGFASKRITTFCYFFRENKPETVFFPEVQHRTHNCMPWLAFSKSGISERYDLTYRKTISFYTTHLQHQVPP